MPASLVHQLRPKDGFNRLDEKKIFKFIAPAAAGPGDGAGAAVVTVNHTFGEIARLPDRLLVMEEGRFVVDDSPEALRARMKKVVGRGPLPGRCRCSGRQAVA